MQTSTAKPPIIRLPQAALPRNFAVNTLLQYICPTNPNNSITLYVCSFISPLTWGHHRLREAWPSHRSNGVAVDVVFPSLDGQSVGQPQQAQLGRAVVGLAKVAIDACGRSRHDDSDHRSAIENVSVRLVHENKLSLRSPILNLQTKYLKELSQKLINGQLFLQLSSTDGDSKHTNHNRIFTEDKSCLSLPDGSTSVWLRFVD